MERYKTLVSLDGDYCLNFKIVEIGGYIGGLPEGDKPFYGHYEDNITDSALAKYEASGTIKWDGCANISYGEECIPHFCGYEQFQEFQKALDDVWKQAQEHFKNKYPEGWP